MQLELNDVTNGANAIHSARGSAEQRADVLQHLAQLTRTIDRSTATEIDVTLLDYYLGNLWNGLKCLAGPHRSGSWQWDAAELEAEIM